VVGMLFPQGPTICVQPSSFPVDRSTVPIDVMGDRANVDSGTVPPNGKVVQVQVTSQSDGVFVEAQLDSNSNDDMTPLGITPNKGKAQGTFFYAVGFNAEGADRVGFVRLPMPKHVKHPRDDDDDDDGCCSPSRSGWHNSDADDDDDDGVPNEYDTPTANENATIGDPAPLSAGQSINYPITASPTSLALIAIATADDPLAQITVEIHNALGMLVAGTVSTPGSAVSTLLLPAAGTYTVHLTNVGLGSFNHTPTLVVREPWLP
jgi:hypothetical protein